MSAGNPVGLVKAAAAAADPAVELNLRILKLEQRLQRERLARHEAEAIAEKGLRELYEKQQQLALLEAIATKANQSLSVEETLQYALKAICDHTGWPFGNVYLTSTDAEPELLPSRLWHAADPEGLTDFLAVSHDLKFAAGQGLPGRVLASGEPIWITDVTEDRNFPRAAAAAECGLHAAFAFPVLLGRKVMAVLEFFFREAHEQDSALLGVMAQIGTQLGRVMERKSAEEQLIHDASHDPLTGLPNRLLFTDRLERAIAIRKRRSEFGFAVIFIDLDRFKLVNDSLGHGAGDALLVEIARRLSAVIAAEERNQESSGIATLARLGGDEFTVLLEEVQNARVALDLAERMQDALRRPMLLEGQEVYSSASFGIASSETDYDSVADIMRDADLAMYRAKAEGRSRVEVFDKSMHHTAVQRLALESDLRGALMRNEFVLHYQPIISLESGELAGFEALLRWQRGKSTLVMPGDFIDIAEETGLIVYIGNWVLREACRTAALWHRLYPRPKPLSMSINVSLRQFHQPDFVSSTISAINESGVDPHAIRLEVTESVTSRDAERTIEILRELREFGVGISIDDFGTGYSSLSYLHQLPFDTLKIDRSFVKALQQRSEGREIIQTILDLARNLKMNVVAEGTETAAHVDQLREMGCHFAQGFFFSHPLDAEAATKLLDAPSPMRRQA